MAKMSKEERLRRQRENREQRLKQVYGGASVAVKGVEVMKNGKLVGRKGEEWWEELIDGPKRKDFAGKKFQW